MRTIKLMVPALFLFAALNVTYRMVSRNENSTAMLLSAVEKAEASGEFDGTESFAKLKRCSCTMPGNSLTRVSQFDIDFGATKKFGDKSNKTNLTISVAPSYSHKTTVQGTEGFYTDCKFSLFKRCDRSEMNFTCRQ